MPGGEHLPALLPASGRLRVLRAAPASSTTAPYSSSSRPLRGCPVSLMAVGFRRVFSGGAGGLLGFCFVTTSSDHKP